MKTLFPYGAALGLLLVTAVSADTPPVSPPASADSTQQPGPVVRASQQPAADTRDGRENLGGVIISMPRFGTPPAGAAVQAPANPSASNPSPPSAPAPAPRPVRADGMIEVPLNTIGPGESLQHRSEREAYEREYARARAHLAVRQAEQPIVTDAFGYPLRGYPYYGGYGAVWSGYRYDRLPLQPIGPVTTTTTGIEGQLHGAALKDYSDAAAAGTGVLGNMHQQAIGEFGRAAAPPIAPIVERQQEVQRNLQKDTFRQPPPPRSRRR